MRIDFQKMNLESEFYYDMIYDRGFIIKDMPFADIDKSIKNMDGPRSPRYGTTYGDNNEFMDRYRCKCGRTIGAVFEEDECPHCHSKVEYKDVDISFTGWIDFSPYKVINPLFYQRLQSALSKKQLENIISNENIITSQGIIRRKNDILEVKNSMLRYHNLGLKEFYDNYEEIMMYYKSKRKIKADVIDSLIEDKNLVWTSKIPVYSTILRPMGLSSESFYFSPLDREINPLTNISINLKNASAIEVPLYLFQAQMRVNKLWQLNFSLIDSKHGSNNIGSFSFNCGNILLDLNY